MDELTVSTTGRTKLIRDICQPSSPTGATKLAPEIEAMLYQIWEMPDKFV